jgi:hypothetical protein
MDVQAESGILWYVPVCFRVFFPAAPIRSPEKNTAHKLWFIPEEKPVYFDSKEQTKDKST